VLYFAYDCEHIDRVPKFSMEREPEKLPRYVSTEHFAVIYRSCAAANAPDDLPYSAGVFWCFQHDAGIWLPCPDAGDSIHGECTAGCHRYGFHDEQRGFATLNAENMIREALQSLMRHRSPSTTAQYINHAKQVNPAVANLHVPEVLKFGAG